MAVRGEGIPASGIDSDSTLVTLGEAGAAAFHGGHWYMAGRLLAPKASLPGFKGTIAAIWHLKSGLTIQDAGERFVFQFESEAVRNRILHGGPWFYRNTMLVVGAYDGLGPVEAVPLNTMETWVGVKGLPFALRNRTALELVGASLGLTVRVDLTAVKRKEEEQRVKIVFDVRRRIRTWKVIEFSPVVKPELSFFYEKVKGFCRDCGLFTHDALGCDKLLTKEKAEIQAAPPASAMAGLSLSSGAGFPRSPVGPGRGLEMEQWRPRCTIAPAMEKGAGSKDLQAGEGPAGKGGKESVRSLGVVDSQLVGTPILLDIGLAGFQDGGGRHIPVAQGGTGALSLAVAPAATLNMHETAHVKFSSMQVMSAGRKRKAITKLEQFGKKYLVLPDSSLEVEDDVSLILQHKNGKILVSPKKKKMGRPKGSKNRVKSTEEQEEKKLRKYKRRGRVLSLDPIPEASVPDKGVGKVTVLEGMSENTPLVVTTTVEGAMAGGGEEAVRAASSTSTI